MLCSKGSKAGASIVTSLCAKLLSILTTGIAIRLGLRLLEIEQFAGLLERAGNATARNAI